MSSMAEVAKALRKEFGADAGGRGVDKIQAVRIPVGYYMFDVALGGGFPRGQASVIFGTEGSGKTTLALRALANHQRLWPDQHCAFIDIENSFDKDWARLHGVDVDKLYYWQPDVAEDTADVAESMLCADDCGLVVIDSIAALFTKAEIQESASKELPGGGARAIRKMYGKTSTAIRKADREKRHPSLIYINQIRHKIGVMYGNPETMPGGFSVKFQPTLTVRVWGTTLQDNKISKIMPYAQKIKVAARKHKLKLCTTQTEIDMALIPHKGYDGVFYNPGEADEWKWVYETLEAYKLFTKEKKGYHCLGVDYGTLKEMWQHLRQPERRDEVTKVLVDKILEDHYTAGG